MTTLYEHIGHKIRELRTSYPKGMLSQEALAEKLKVASNTVSRWETGTYKPTPKDLDGLDPRVSALTSATGGLEDKDFEEVIRYAEFRKARRAMENAKRSKKKA